MSDLYAFSADEIAALQEVWFNRGYAEGKAADHTEAYQRGMLVGMERGYVEGYIQGEIKEREFGRSSIGSADRVDFGRITRDRGDVVILENAK